MASIDTSKVRGEYQPLAPLSARLGVVGGVAGRVIEVDRDADDASREAVRAALVAAGFREVDGEWWSATCYAIIVASYATGTIGVEVSRNGLASYHTHVLDGTYDALPVEEKFRLSGWQGSMEEWVAAMHRAGRPV